MEDKDRYNIDIDNPFIGGRCNFISGYELLRQQLEMVIETYLGSLVYNLSYGSRLHFLVGDNIVDTFYGVAEEMVRDAIFSSTGYLVRSVKFRREGSGVYADIVLDKKFDSDIITLGIGQEG